MSKYQLLIAVFFLPLLTACDTQCYTTNEQGEYVECSSEQKDELWQELKKDLSNAMHDLSPSSLFAGTSNKGETSQSNYTSLHKKSERTEIRFTDNLSHLLTLSQRFERSQYSGRNDYLIGKVSKNDEVIDYSAKKSGGRVAYHIIGGYSQLGTVKENYALQAGGKTSGSLIGGISEHNFAINNTATQAGGVVNGSIYGGYSRLKNAHNNHALNAGGVVSGYLIGGFSEKNGNANNNEAFKGGGKVRADVIGGVSLAGEANNNLVTIHGNGAEGKIIGAMAHLNTNHNRVIIEGVSINDDIIGGLTERGQAVNNTVELTIRGGGKYFANWGLWTTVPNLADNVTLYGGLGTTEQAGDVKTGNTLIFHTFGFSAKNIKNFSEIVFNIDDNFTSDDHFLTLLDKQGSDLSGVTITLNDQKAKIKQGETITLLNNTNGIIFGKKTLKTDRFVWEISVQNNALVAKAVKVITKSWW